MKNIKAKEYQKGRHFVLTLSHEANLDISIKEFLMQEKITAATICSATGFLNHLLCHNPMTGAHLPMTLNRFKTSELQGPLTLLSLSGNIFVDENNELGGDLYVCASNVNGELIGGLLLKAPVFGSCEITLAELKIGGVMRHQCKTTGMTTLSFVEG